MSKEEQIKNFIQEPNLDHSCQKSLETPFFSKGNWPKKCWWEDFESEELNALVSQAIAKNPSIQSVREKISLAKEKAKSAKSKLYPLVYFDADDQFKLASKYGIERAYNPDFPKQAQITDLTLSFNYEFDFWDKYRNLFKSYLSLEEAQKAETSQIELIVSTSLSKTFFALKTNLAKEKLFRFLYEVRRKIFLLRQLLLDGAIDDLRIVLLSNERAEEAKKWLFDIEEEIAINRHLVNILAGNGPDDSLEIEADLPLLPPSLKIPKTLSLDLLSRRPDLMAQLWRVESLAHEVGAARADFFPSINLASIAGLSSTIYNALFHPSSFEGTLVPSLSLPVYTAGDIQATLDAKRAEYQSAVFSYNDLILNSAKEVVDTLAFAKAVFGKKEEQEKIVDQAGKRLILSKMRLLSGLDTALATLMQKEELLEKELDDLDLAYGRYDAAISLVKALGGGYKAE